MPARTPGASSFAASTSRSTIEPPAGCTASPSMRAGGWPHSSGRPSATRRALDDPGVIEAGVAEPAAPHTVEQLIATRLTLERSAACPSDSGAPPFSSRSASRRPRSRSTRATRSGASTGCCGAKLSGSGRSTSTSCRRASTQRWRASRGACPSTRPRPGSVSAARPCATISTRPAGDWAHGRRPKPSRHAARAEVSRGVLGTHPWSYGRPLLVSHCGRMFDRDRRRAG